MSDLSFLALSPFEWEALRLSLQVAFWSVLGCIPLSIAAAWLLSRTNFPGRSLLDGILHLPLVVPPVVIGYLLLVAMGRNGVASPSCGASLRSQASSWRTFLLRS